MYSTLAFTAHLLVNHQNVYNMSNLQVCRLHKTNDEELLKLQSASFKPARLRSLQLDPQGFSSRYENEVNQPIDFWIDRLRPDFVEHFMLIEAAESATGEVADGEALVVGLERETRLMGFMILINDSLAARAKGRDMEHSVPEEFLGLETYYMAAMWVDPSARGQGSAGMLVQASINWIKADARSRELKKVLFRTAAFATNLSAIRAYEKKGFVIAKGHDEVLKDGRSLYNMYLVLVID